MHDGASVADLDQRPDDGICAGQPLITPLQSAESAGELYELVYGPTPPAPPIPRKETDEPYDRLYLNEKEQ